MQLKLQPKKKKKKKKKKAKEQAGRAESTDEKTLSADAVGSGNGSGSGSDRYHPSPILDDFSTHSEGRLPKLDRKFYEKELAQLQVELVKMQYWIKHTGYRLIILFEGRDAAGKGGTIKRVTEPLNPRGCKVVALGTPSDQQKSQWYFQRYGGKGDGLLQPGAGGGIHAVLPGIRTHARAQWHHLAEVLVFGER